VVWAGQGLRSGQAAGVEVTDLPSIKAYRIGSFSSHEFRPYRYNGDQPGPVEPTKPLPTVQVCEEADCEGLVYKVGMCNKHYYRYRTAIKADPSLRKPRAVTVFKPDKCGTNAGYQRHTSYKQEPCRPCKEAHNISRNERKNAAKARKEAGNGLHIQG
jgi:hypothetical protein